MQGRQFQVDDEVGGVTSRRQGSLARKHTVSRRDVDASLRFRAVDRGHEMEQRHFLEELLRVTLGETMVLEVPLAALEEETVDVDSVVRSLLDVFV